MQNFLLRKNKLLYGCGLLLEEIVPIFKNFRDRIYRFFPSRRDAAMELVDALSSNRTASSVVALSLSPLHRRNYCSITRVLDEYMSKCSVEAQQQKQELTHLLSRLCPSAQQREYHLFAVDCTPEPRIFSPTLEDRSYVYAPNAVCGNKPVTVGHKYSIAAYLPEKPDANTPPWLIPLACTRIDTTQHVELAGMEQISACIKSRSEFKNQLSVSLGDTAYNNSLCLGIAKNNVNQVHVSRSLYLSRSLANILPNPWQRYLPAFKSNATIKSPTQVQNDFERIIRMIGTPAQPPKPRQKAPGRELGDIQIKRTRHPIVKKSKNTTVTEKMIA